MKTINDLARGIVSLVKAYHRGTSFEEEFSTVAETIDPTWTAITEKLYHGYCKAIGERPRTGIWILPTARGLQIAEELEREKE